MSATGRGAERQESDFYATHAWCVHRLLEVLRPPTGRWLEPAVGDGAIVRACVEQGYDRVAWTTVDIVKSCEADYHADFTLWQSNARFDFIITNPPYGQALAFVRAALERAPLVAMLLRLNWLASDARAPFLQEHTPSAYVLPNRPNFLKGQINPADGKPYGGDATEYAWMVWGMGEPRIVILNTTPGLQR